MKKAWNLGTIFFTVSKIELAGYRNIFALEPIGSSPHKIFRCFNYNNTKEGYHDYNIEAVDEMFEKGHWKRIVIKKEEYASRMNSVV